MTRSTLISIFGFLGLLLSGSRVFAAETPVTLENGLRVAVRERHVTPLVAIDLWVQAGSREEGPDEYGSAHFLEHTLFKGTSTLAPGEADIAIENLGATFSAATGPDYAHFYTTVASAHFEAALAILADVVQHPTLPADEMEKERRVILDELAQHASDGNAVLRDQLYTAAFASHPYRLSPGGSPEAIRRISREVLLNFYRKTYAPQRCVLTIVGDIVPEQAAASATRLFGKWKVPTVSAGKNELLADTDALGTAPVTAKIPAGRVGVALRAPAGREREEACLTQLLAALLGSSENGGRLANATLAGTEARASYTPRRETSLLLLTARPPNSDSNPLPTVLRSLLTSPPREAEIAAARQQIFGRLQFETETNAGLARAVGYAELIETDTPEQLRKRLLQVTPVQFRQFLTKFLRFDRVVIVGGQATDAKF